MQSILRIRAWEQSTQPKIGQIPIAGNHPKLSNQRPALRRASVSTRGKLRYALVPGSVTAKSQVHCLHPLDIAKKLRRISRAPEHLESSLELSLELVCSEGS